MNDDNKEQLEDKFSNDVLAQVQRSVNDDEYELGEQHTEERRRYLDNDNEHINLKLLNKADTKLIHLWVVAPIKFCEVVTSIWKIGNLFFTCL